MTIRRVLENNKDYVIKQVQEGRSYASLAREFDCNSGTIWYFLQDYNVTSKYKQSPNHGKKHKYKDLVIQLFVKDNRSVYSISKEIGISNSTVNKWLKDWGYDTSKGFTVDPNKVLLKDRLGEVLELYNKGFSQGDIAKKMGYGYSSISRLLTKHKIIKRSVCTYSVNENYFNQVDSEYKAYILGWLYSDGNVRYEGKIRIALQEEDKSILEWMKQELEYTGPLYYKKSQNGAKPQWELCINRKKLADRIIELGCIPNKSMTLTFPSANIIPNEFLSAFVRGYIEGDGSITHNYMSIVGTLEFVYTLKTRIPCEITNIYQRYQDRDPKDSSHQLFICRQEECKKFAQWLYKDATIYLTRKYDIAKEYFLD